MFPSKKNGKVKKLGGLAQLARALRWQCRGHRFESVILHQRLTEMWVFFYFSHKNYPWEKYPQKKVRHRSCVRLILKSEKKRKPKIGLLHSQFL